MASSDMVAFKIVSQREAKLSLIFGVVDEVECREVVVADHATTTYPPPNLYYPRQW